MNDSKENLTTGGFSGTPQNAGRSGHRVENTALLIMVALCLLFIGLSMTVFKGTDFRADLAYFYLFRILHQTGKLYRPGLCLRRFHERAAQANGMRLQTMGP